MADNFGYIKAYRSVMEKGFYKKPDYHHVWIHLLYRAVFIHTEFVWNGKTIILEPGQLITGRDALSRETGVQSLKVERILKFLENEQQIEQQKTNRYRLITIINWRQYQNSEQQNEQPVNNQRTTDEQQMNTYKNIKKEKKEKKEKKNTPPTPKGADWRFETLWQEYPRKIGKGIALKSFQKIKPDRELFEKMIDTIQKARTCEQWSKDSGQFIPHLSTWLNQGRWDDVIEYSHKLQVNPAVSCSGDTHRYDGMMREYEDQERRLAAQEHEELNK